MRGTGTPFAFFGEWDPTPNAINCVSEPRKLGKMLFKVLLDAI